MKYIKKKTKTKTSLNGVMDRYTSQLEEVAEKLSIIEKQIEHLETNAHSVTPPIIILGAGI